MIFSSYKVMSHLRRRWYGFKAPGGRLMKIRMGARAASRFRRNSRFRKGFRFFGL